MQSITLTNAQARRFLLRYHGLIGEPLFEGKQGVLDYVRQCGCVQFDPIDVCGRNADLVFQSRVKGYKKTMLDELLYKDRALVDYFDKNLAILPVEDWPYFERDRAHSAAQGRSFDEVEAASATVLKTLGERECISSAELDMNEKVDWYWNSTRLSRAVLESLYFRGKLCVHHKQGTIKHYTLAERVIPAHILAMADPFPRDEDFRDWQTLRRIGAVGMLQNRASDAFLCAKYHKAGGRTAAFASLIDAGLLIEVNVEGIPEPFYARSGSAALLGEILSGARYAPRTALIAPLDCFMWDRKLIEKLFGFSYTWEIYTPEVKRQYGYYVLPLIRGEGFAGRVEAVVDRKRGVLVFKNVWWEGRACAAELRKCLKRFARFNGCTEVEGI